MKQMHPNYLLTSLRVSGSTLQSGKPFKLELKDGESHKMDMACLGPKLRDENGRSVVMGKSTWSDELAVCYLQPVYSECSALSLLFQGPEILSFRLLGNNEGCLTGSFTYQDEDVSDDEETEKANSDK